MKKILYSSKELHLLKGLVNTTPKKIVVDFASVYLDFGEYHLEFVTHSLPASTQNKVDEAIIASVEKIKGSYKPGKNQKTLKNMGVIKEVYLVRTLLYFTGEEPVSFFSKLQREFKYFFYKYILRKKIPTGDFLLRGVVSQHLECICNPDSAEAKKQDPKYSNLLDLGVLLITKSGLTPIFPDNNGYGFFLVDRKICYTPEELSRFVHGQYKFIKL